VLNCLLDPMGHTEDCRVIEETPQDEGFGEAALREAKAFAFKPAMVNGAPVGGVSVTVPVNFKLE
jgi:protein TonB